jgi:hypothetical protein
VNPARDIFCVPINLMQRDETRRFTASCEQAGCDCGEAMAALLWLDFGSQQRIWRAMRGNPAEGLDGDQTARLIEANIGWRGKPGAIIGAALDSGFMRVTKEGDLNGFELAGFRDCNPHLAPGWKSMQQLGGAAAAMRAKKDGTAARQQTMLLKEAQIPLGFDVSDREKEQAVALIRQLDRIGNRGARLTKDYTASLLEAAIKVRREFTPEEIETVQRFVLAARENYPLGADSVIPHWSRLVAEAGARK